MSASYPTPAPSPATVDRFIALIREGGGEFYGSGRGVGFTTPYPERGDPDPIAEALDLRMAEGIKAPHIMHRLAVEAAPHTPEPEAVTAYVAALRAAGYELVLSGGEVWLRPARPLDTFVLAEANLQAERDGVTFVHVGETLRAEAGAA